MRDFLKRYQVKLEILTPVYIGSGQEITKKEYIYYKNTRQAWIPDKGRLLKDIIRKNLADEFERYMLDGTEPLLNWMKSKGYSDKEIQGLCGYYLDCSQALENLNRPVAIQEFVKDAYGVPYIPGSSLKGAIRTGILGSRILKHPKKYASIRQSTVNSSPVWNGKPNKKYLVSEGKRIEEAAFHTLNKNKIVSDVKNDELKGIYISDSQPLSLENLVLCQKIDVNLEGKRNALNILRESLKPGTVVEFEMTIDTSVIHMDEQDILQALKNTWEFYQNAYVRKFVNMTKAEGGNLYLGGGCGFGTKTVSYELLGEREGLKVVSQLMNLKFKKHGHRGDVSKGISPHILKCTNYGGKLCEMGKCKVDIVEIG